MDVELIKKAINKAFDEHLTEVDNFNDAIFDTDRIFFIASVVKNICDSQCCVTHESKEIQVIEVSQTRLDDLNLNAEQLAAGCDEACWFHCTKGGSQDASCLEPDNSIFA